jgi:deazaflavin-dependent oxidoreductase (nitroreductase family)
MPGLDRAAFKLSHGHWTLTSKIAGLPMVMLTTTGARSGMKRTTPLVAVLKTDDITCLALVASNWGQDHHPAWYHNLKANPAAAGTIDGVTRNYRAREAVGQEYDDFWHLACQAYFAYTLYKQRVRDRRIPILVLEIEAGSTPE